MTSWSGIKRLMNFLGIGDYDSLLKLLDACFVLFGYRLRHVLDEDAKLVLGIAVYWLDCLIAVQSKIFLFIRIISCLLGGADTRKSCPP